MRARQKSKDNNNMEAELQQSPVTHITSRVDDICIEDRIPDRIEDYEALIKVTNWHSILKILMSSLIL